MDISRDDWLKALTEAGYHDAEVHDDRAVTVDEFAEMFGVSHNTAASRLNRLVESGHAKRVFKWGTTTYGRRVQYRAYLLTKGQ